MYNYIFSGDSVLKSCLCFNPSAPADSRISRIADMNYERYNHSLIVADGKLYAIGGWTEILHIFIWNICSLRYNEHRYGQFFCNSIEEYDPKTNNWQLGEFNLKIGGGNSFNDSHKILFYSKEQE